MEKSNLADEHRAARVDDLAIRFINTKAWRLRSPPEERLGSAEDLLHWAAANGINFGMWGENPAIRLNERSGAATEFLLGAQTLREAMYEIFRARMLGSAPPSSALRIFADALADGGSQVEIAFEHGALVWHARPETPIAPRGLLWPVAISAAELITGPRAGRVRQCQDERGCGWLFVDQSRAGNRRWCSMGDCGNIAKSRRHYERNR